MRQDWISCGIALGGLLAAVVPAHARPQGAVTTIQGCTAAYGLPIEFDTEVQAYNLTGNTSVVAQLLAHGMVELQLEGVVHPDGQPISEFEVTKIVNVIPRPPAQLTAAFRDRSKWQTERFAKYGVSFQHPDGALLAEAPDPSITESFIVDDGAVWLGGFIVDREIYPRSNFVGGNLGLWTNPKVTTRASCEQFALSERSQLSPAVIGRVRYTRMDDGGAAAGTYYDALHLHTFQNGRCYEVAISSATYTTGNVTGGCMIPELSSADYKELTDLLTRGVSFFQRANKADANGTR